VERDDGALAVEMEMGSKVEVIHVYMPGRSME
jgi:hypothetical protein